MLCLAGCPGKALYVIGVVCSSWSSVNLGTSQRDEMTPLGNTNIPSIRAGNLMVARSGLLMLNWKMITPKALAENP